MNVHKIKTDDKRDVQKFIHFPYSLYKDDPIWVPPLISDTAFFLNKNEHPFYHHSEAEFFIAEHKGKILGRIALIDNRKYQSYTNSKTGFFYFFEVVEDIEITRALFSAIFEEARKRGLDKLFGPKGMIQGDSQGLLVEGFEHRPANGISYNPPYYDHYVIDSGFEKHSDYLSGYLTPDYKLPDRIFKLADRVKKQRGFWVKIFDNKEEMRKWIPQIQEVYNKAFTVVPGFCPISKEEVQIIAERIISVADPSLIKLVFKEDQIVGFLFAYPNIAKGLQKAKGKLLPFGWFHILQDKKRTEWLDFNGIGLLPEHQGVGANAVLYVEMEKSVRQFAKKHKIKYVDMVQVNEINAKSMADMKALGIIWYKRHRVYQRHL
jgi:GNAT superfamily N-acetyltransferase